MLAASKLKEFGSGTEAASLIMLIAVSVGTYGDGQVLVGWQSKGIITLT